MNEHISDERLIELCLTGPAPPEHAHLVVCRRCEGRRGEIVSILAELDEAATQDAGDAFPAARLEKQHAEILQRVEDDGRPGRLVPFPSQQPSSIIMTTSRPQMRWAAAVAAAAFAAGVITGQWTQRRTDRDLPGTRIVTNETDQTSLRAVPTTLTFSDDEFLGQIEVAASRNGPVALRPLDAMTPRAWEVR